MKLAFRDIEPFVKKPPPKALAVLVYGPDAGLVRERLNLLTKSVVADVSDPFNVAEFSEAQLLENPARLLDEAKSISMLGGRRVVRLRDAGDKSSAILKEVLPQLSAGDGFILIEAGELSPRSSLRILFEGADNAAALPCYVDDARDIGRVLAEDLRGRGFQISADALAYMAQNVTGDRAVARMEAEKLSLYMGGQRAIDLEDVTAAIGAAADMPMDDLAKHVGLGQFAEADRILRHLLSEGEAAVRILRSLQTHFMKLHLTRARMQKGDTLESALAKIKPPLFFKVKPFFEAQVALWPLDRLSDALAILGSAEAKSKRTGQEPDLLLGRALLALCQMANKGARRRA